MKHRMTLAAGTAAATVSLLGAATAAGAATTGVRACADAAPTRRRTPWMRVWCSKTNTTLTSMGLEAGCG